VNPIAVCEPEFAVEQPPRKRRSKSYARWSPLRAASIGAMRKFHSRSRGAILAATKAITTAATRIFDCLTSLHPSQSLPDPCKCSGLQEKIPAPSLAATLAALPLQNDRLVRDDQMVWVVPFLM